MKIDIWNFSENTECIFVLWYLRYKNDMNGNQLKSISKIVTFLYRIKLSDLAKTE